MSLAGALPAARGSHRRLSCFSSLTFNRRRLRSFVFSTSRNANVVRARTAGEGGPDDAQKAPPSSSAATAAPKGESVSGVGFGSGTSGGDGGKGSRKSKVVRRTPVQKPLIQSVATATEKDDGGALPEQEKAFLLVWLGLGLLILVEGIALAGSGFLPEEWDNLFVKYLYPSFTPTVVLFLGGTVAYGVFKYLKAGQSKS